VTSPVKDQRQVLYVVVYRVPPFDPLYRTTASPPRMPRTTYQAVEWGVSGPYVLGDDGTPHAVPPDTRAYTMEDGQAWLAGKVGDYR